MIPQAKHFYEFGQFRIDEGERLLLRRGEPVPLAPKVFDTLLALVKNRGHVLGKETLMQELWPDTFVEESNLKYNISQLRKALGDGAEERYIETVPRRGYRFTASVREAGEETATVTIEERSQVHAVVEKRLPTSDSATGTEPLPPARPGGSRRHLWIAVAAAALILSGLAITGWRLLRSDYFWKNPLTNAQITRITDFEGTERDAILSSDGTFVIFLADRDGPFDAWVSQVGSGVFVNVTKGQFPALLDEVARSVGFSADSTQVWVRGGEKNPLGREIKFKIGTWLIPTMGGLPRLFIEGINAVWSPDGNRVVYFQADPGDPIYVADRQGNNPKQIYVDPLGGHCHYQAWSPDGRFIYFVKGLRPREADIWRVPSEGGQAERITHYNSHIAYPTLLDDRTLLYTVRSEDGSGYGLYSIDVERRIPHRLNLGVEQYVSVSASADGSRLVATVSNPSGNLWTVPVSEGVAGESAVKSLTLPTARAVVPRSAPDYLLYFSSRGGDDNLWKFKDGTATELWKAGDGMLAAPPAVSPDGREICLVIRKQGRTGLYLMTSDGTNVRPLAESVVVRDAPSWSPDGTWIAAAGDDGKGMRLYKVPVRGGAPILLSDDFASTPAWSPDGSFILYSGSRTEYPVKAVTPDKKPFPLTAPDFRFRAGVGDRYRFLPHSKALVVLLGEYRQQNFWLVSVETGRLRQLTDLKPGYSITGFDVSPDGKHILFDRVRENSDIVLMDLKRGSLR